MCCVILAEYQLIVLQQLGRLDVTRISIAIMGVMSVVKRVGEIMSLHRMVFSMPCQRSSRIHCFE